MSVLGALLCCFSLTTILKGILIWNISFNTRFILSYCYQVNISHWGEPELDLSYGSAHHNSEWMIQNVSVVRHTQLYGCCPEPYVDITGYVTLSRRHSYVIQVYVAPAVTFILLTPAVFMLPPESSHKFILGMYNFLFMDICNKWKYITEEATCISVGHQNRTYL